jgi:hypothetical protein
LKQQILALTDAAKCSSQDFEAKSAQMQNYIDENSSLLKDKTDLKQQLSTV